MSKKSIEATKVNKEGLFGYQRSMLVGFFVLKKAQSHGLLIANQN
jgi:hypothetical protein